MNVLLKSVKAVFCVMVMSSGVVTALSPEQADLLNAIKRNDLTQVKALLNNVNPNGQDSVRTLLHYAVQKGNEDIVRALLDAGANPNVADLRGRTPLQYVQEEGYYKNQAIADLLLELGATPDKQELFDAIQGGDASTVANLINQGVNVNVVDDVNRTPLYLAAMQGNAEIVALLIAARADLDTPDGQGRTPLHRAAIGGHKGVATLLLNAGADKRDRDRYGKTPYEVAKQYGHQDVQRVLEY